MPLFIITSDLVPRRLVSAIQDVVRHYPDDILYEVALVQAAMRYACFAEDTNATGHWPGVTMRTLGMQEHCPPVVRGSSAKFEVEAFTNILKTGVADDTPFVAER